MAHPYATVDQVFTAFPPTRSGVGVGSFDVTTLELSSYHIWTAQGIIDAYLSRRYATPLPTDPLITKITVDLCIYSLMSERAMKTPDWVIKRYENSMKMLDMLRDGKLTINSATLIESGDQFAFANNKDYHPVFSPVLDPLQQRVDREFVDNERNIRSGDDDNVDC